MSRRKTFGEDCPVCKGDGQVGNQDCPKCDGQGSVLFSDDANCEVCGKKLTSFKSGTTVHTYCIWNYIKSKNL